MAISPYPACVSLPELEQPFPSVLEFLVHRFPRMGRACWEMRVEQGKVLDEEGAPITSVTPYRPRQRIFYFREVEHERIIPFSEEILFQNDQFLVACKPHFLPVTPGGAYVEECLLHRLRKRTGIDHLVPLHRLDRDTAGVVLFSVNPETRGVYGGLFKNGGIEKIYQAISAGSASSGEAEWRVENRLAAAQEWFRTRVVPGAPNARSHIRLMEVKDGLSMFRLSPLTGKTHQLRVHMSGLGFGIVNDRYYPRLQDERPDDFGKPLQLLAKSVKFRDPISGEPFEFESPRTLLW
ncbi:MAG TPA: pseudouridine synthase [Geobacter sp.]|nr:pseudouridine synthase [Geobacter sp.]